MEMMKMLVELEYSWLLLMVLHLVMKVVIEIVKDLKVHQR